MGIKSLRFGSKMNRIVYSLIRLVLFSLVALALAWLLDRYTIVKLNNTALVTMTSILEILVLIKTVGKDLGSVFNVEELSAIEEGRATRSDRFVDLFVCIIRNQILYVLPYYVAYAILRSVSGSFIINSVITLFALALIIMVWAIVIYGVNKLINNSLHCPSKRSEAVVRLILLVISVLFLLSKDGVMPSKTSTNIVDFYNNTITLLQTFGLSFDGNISIIINIIAIFLVVECAIACVKYVIMHTELTLDVQDEVVSLIPVDNRATLFNTIRPCLARSPTV